MRAVETTARHTTYDIRDARGRLIARHHRTDKPDGTKQVWWEADGKRGLNGTPLPSLPLYGAELVEDCPEDGLIVLVEGEKARDALEAVEISAVGTVTGAGGTPGQEALEVLRGREVTLWPDNDDAGREHMRRVAERLQDVACEVRWYEWPEAPEKGDAADHPATQSGSAKAADRLLNELACAPAWRPEEREGKAGRNGKPETFTAAELMSFELPEVRWAVPGIVPEGVTLFAGKPKLGKSWAALGMCVAVATGDVALGKVRVEQGEALYLGLEDNRRRLQKRLQKLLAGGSAPAGLHLATDWPRLGEGGMEALNAWLGAHPDARIMVIDTLARFKPRASGKYRSAYDEDRDAVDPLVAVAAEHGVAIVLVHHLREMESDDPLDMIHGSAGLTGGVDGALVLKRQRGQADAYLHIDGRDIEQPTELALKFDPEAATWAIVGDAEEYRMSEGRRAISSILENADEPLGPKDITAMLNDCGHKVAYGAVREMLSQMVKNGQARNLGRGAYVHPDYKNSPDNADSLTKGGG